MTSHCGSPFFKSWVEKKKKKSWVEFRNFVKLPTPGVWEQRRHSSLTKFSISSPVNVLFRSDFSFDGSLSAHVYFPGKSFYPVFLIWATKCQVSFVFLPTSCLYVICFHMASFHTKRYVLVVTNYSTSFPVFFSNVTIMSSVFSP